MYVIWGVIILGFIILYIIKYYFIDIKILYYYIKMAYFNDIINLNIPNSELITTENGTQVIKIYYKYNQKIYNIYIPIHKIRYNNNKYFYKNDIFILIKSQEHIKNISSINHFSENIIYYQEIDITQQKGIEYYVSAELLGGEKIICKNIDEIVEEFNKNKIPDIKKR
jgi:hypothetical protein